MVEGAPIIGERAGISLAIDPYQLSRSTGCGNIDQSAIPADRERFRPYSLKDRYRRIGEFQLL
jgi:hypothetical protein